MLTSLAPFLIFLAVVLFIGGIYSVVMDIFMRDNKRMTDRIDEEFRSKQKEKIKKKTSLFKDIGKMASEAQQGEPTLAEKFEAMIDQSGMDDMTTSKLMGMCAAGAVVMGVVGFFTFSFLGLLLGPLLGFYMPIAFVKFKRNQRIGKIRAQLPDTFDLMARVIRAGQTMTQAMQAVTDEMPQPISIEFAICNEQMNLGIPPDVSLRDLARRTGILELQIFVMALLIQRQTGGNLAELLDGISTVVRQRFKILGQIQTLTAEGRMQAAVLLALPPGMAVIMLVINPKYASGLWDHPILLVMILVSESIGALWIRKIVNFEF